MPITPLLKLAACLALVIALLVGWHELTSHYETKGRNEVRAEWTAAVAAANAEARRLEQARQRRADEAAQMAAQREAGIRAAAAGARRDADSVRDASSAAVEYAHQSRAAAERTAGLATELLGQCSRALVGMAEAADRSDSEARQLRQAWPK